MGKTVRGLNKNQRKRLRTQRDAKRIKRSQQDGYGTPNKDRRIHVHRVDDEGT